MAFQKSLSRSFEQGKWLHNHTIREIHGPGLYRRGRSIRLWTPATAYSRTTADELRSKFPEVLSNHIKPPEYIQYLPNESNKPDYLFTGEFGKRYRDMKYLNATEHMWPPYYWDEAFRGPPIELRKAVDSPVKFYSFNASDPNRVLAYRGSAWQNRGATFPQMLRNSTGGLEILGGDCKQPHLCPAYKDYPAGYVGGGGANGQHAPKMWMYDGSPFGRFSYNIPPTPHYMSPESLLKRWQEPRYNVSKLVAEDDNRTADGEDRLWPSMKRWTQGGLTQRPWQFSMVDRYCNHYKNYYKKTDTKEDQAEVDAGKRGDWEHKLIWDNTHPKRGDLYADDRVGEDTNYGFFGWLKRDPTDPNNCRKAMLMRNRKILKTK